MKIIDGIVNDISPYARNSSVKNLHCLKDNHNQMLEVVKSLKTMNIEDRENWGKIYRSQAQIYKNNRQVIYDFYKRMAELIESENELIHISGTPSVVGIDYENNPEYLELEM